MRIFRLGHDSLKEQYGTFYEKKFERKKKRLHSVMLVLLTIVFCVGMFLLGYWTAL